MKAVLIPITVGLAAVIIRGQSIKPEKKQNEFPETLRRFLRELNWYT